MLKKVTITLSLFLLSLGLAAIAWAEDNSAASNQALNELVSAAKTQINMDLTDWNLETEYISTTETKGYWYLTWDKNDYSEFVSLCVDPVTQELIYAAYSGSGSEGHFTGQPAYNEEACLQIAQDWAAEAWPQAYEQCTLKTKTSPAPTIPASRDYPYQYDFYFYRSQNGYPVSNQGINVTINAETGTLASWSYSWKQAIVLPAADQIISLEQAQTAYQNKPNLELNYTLPNRYDSKADHNPILVYTSNYYDTMVNALTGEVMDSSELFYIGGIDDYSSNVTTKYEETVSSTPQESNQAVSKEKALQIAAAFYPIPANYQLYSADLMGDTGIIGVNACWYLTYQTADALNSISYQINSSTGELISFGHYQDGLAEVKNPISYKEAQYQAEALLKKYCPERFDQLQLQESFVNPRDKADSYYFNYVRMVNGIAYPDNFYGITISGDHGQLIDYMVYWDELDFPAATNLVSKEQVVSQHLKDHPFQVVYAQDTKERYYLVYYSPATGSNSYNAQTGEALPN